MIDDCESVEAQDIDKPTQNDMLYPKNSSRRRRYPLRRFRAICDERD